MWQRLGRTRLQTPPPPRKRKLRLTSAARCRPATTRARYRKQGVGSVRSTPTRTLAGAPSLPISPSAAAGEAAPPSAPRGTSVSLSQIARHAHPHPTLPRSARWGGCQRPVRRPRLLPAGRGPPVRGGGARAGGSAAGPGGGRRGGGPARTSGASGWAVRAGGRAGRAGGCGGQRRAAHSRARSAPGEEEPRSAAGRTWGPAPSMSRRPAGARPGDAASAQP